MMKQANVNNPIQGFAADPAKSQIFTIGTDTSIDVQGWEAIRWATTGDPVTRILNENAVGLTAESAIDVVGNSLFSISFTGTAGDIVQVEGM